MNKFITLIFLSIFFMSCTSNTILEKPKNLIPKDQMIDLITDLFIAAEAKKIQNENLKRNINYAPLLFEKYQIDSTRFMESNLYYTSRIDEYNDILDQVDKRIRSLLEEFENEIEAQDSIERAARFSKSKKPIKKTEEEELEVEFEE